MRISNDYSPGRFHRKLGIKNSESDSASSDNLIGNYPNYFDTKNSLVVSYKKLNEEYLKQKSIDRPIQ